MTISELIDLAKIGRQKVMDDRAQNVIGWLGRLPTEEEIDTAGCRIYHHMNHSFGPIYAQEITDPLE